MLRKHCLSRRQGQEQSLRLLAGEERLNALLVVLFDRNLCVLTRLEIGAKYEKDHEFPNSARRFSSLRIPPKTSYRSYGRVMG
jgi:hypothetical protein